MNDPSAAQADAVEAAPATRAVTTAATAQTVVVRARASLAGGTGAHIKLFVNGVQVGEQTVNATVFTSYSFPVASVPDGSLIDVVFDNDANINGQDRNLFVESVTALGRTLLTSSADVSLDKGLGEAAFDGYGLETAKTGLYWNGSLRYLFRAAEPTWTTVAGANAALGHGVNLGSLFESPLFPGKWGGFTYSGDPSLPIEAAKLNDVAQTYPGVIDELARQGYRHVRLPVRWSLYASRDASATLVSTKGAPGNIYELLDPLVDRAIARGLHVVLNMHWYRALDGAPGDEGDPSIDPTVVEARAIAMWKQIAAHYAGRSKYLVFELYNEPMASADAQGAYVGGLTPGRWNALFPKLLAAVRSQHPTRPVIIDAAESGVPRALWDLNLPANDPWLIASAHAYSPGDFAAQGFGGLPSGVPYSAGAMSATQASIENMGLFARQRQRPVYLGEYGNTNMADSMGRTRHLQFTEQLATAQGLSMAAFDVGTIGTDVDFSMGQVIPGADKAHLIWPNVAWRTATLGAAGLPALPAVAPNLAPIKTAFTAMRGNLGTWNGSTVTWPAGGTGQHASQFVVVTPTTPVLPNTAYRFVGRFSEHANVLVALVDAKAADVFNSPTTVWIDNVNVPDYRYVTPASLPPNAAWLFIFQSGSSIPELCIQKLCGRLPVRPGLTYTVEPTSNWKTGTIVLNGRADNGNSVSIQVSSPNGRSSFTVPAGVYELELGGSGAFDFDLYSAGDAPSVTAGFQVVAN